MPPELPMIPDPGKADVFRVCRCRNESQLERKLEGGGWLLVAGRFRLRFDTPGQVSSSRVTTDQFATSHRPCPGLLRIRFDMLTTDRPCRFARNIIRCWTFEVQSGPVWVCSASGLVASLGTIFRRYAPPFPPVRPIATPPNDLMPLIDQDLRQRPKSLRLPFLGKIVKGVHNPDAHHGKTWHLPKEKATPKDGFFTNGFDYKLNRKAFFRSLQFPHLEIDQIFVDRL